MGVPHPPKEHVVADFKARIACKSNLSDPEMPAPSLSLPYLPCTQPVDMLRPTFIAQLKPKRHHRGRKLIVRVCTDPVRVPAIAAVVEDEKGTAIPLFLFNKPAESIVPAKKILSLGKFYLIKEPFLKFNQKKEAYSINVDHVTDIICLRDTDSRLPDCWRKPMPNYTSDEVRIQGNIAFKNDDLYTALDLYADAIELAKTPEEKQLAHVNRALVNNHLKHYEDAFFDATCMNDVLPPNLKSKHRAAGAHYKLHDFPACHAIAKELIAEAPDNQDFKNMMMLVENRIYEQETGEYDFEWMHKMEAPTSDLTECASFYGPVEVRDSPGRGRGLFLTEDVSVGDLLLCEKAVAYCLRHASENFDEIVLEFGQGLESRDAVDRTETEAPAVDKGSQASLSFQIQQKLLLNPQTYGSITKLFAGDDAEEPAATDPENPAIDAFLIDKIVHFNSVACPSDSKKLFLITSELDGLKAQGTPRGRLTVESVFSGAGVWEKSSYMNHSCVPNCHRAFIRDMQNVRATRDLPAGTELTVSYVPPAPFDWENRRQRKLSPWGFCCTCELCLWKEKITAQHRRGEKSIVKGFEDTLVAIQMKHQLLMMAGCQHLNEDYDDSFEPGVPVLELYHVSWLIMDSPSPLRPPVLVYLAHAALRGAAFELSVSDPKLIATAGLKAETPEQAAVRRDVFFRITKWGYFDDRIAKVFRGLHWLYSAIAPHVCPILREYMAIAFSLTAGERQTFSPVLGPPPII